MEKMITSRNIISPIFERKSGKDVWRENLHLAIFAADKIRSTLGPKGAYKLVTYNRGPEQVFKVTKDAIAILDELAINYPPAVIVTEAAKMQRQEAGDGVATFTVFLSALLKGADDLLTLGIHANTIIHGYSLATEKALQILENQATPNGQSNDILDIVDCQRQLLTPEIRSMIRQAYPYTFYNGTYEPENIRFIKQTGRCLPETSLVRGVVIKKQKAHPNMPDTLDGLRIAITSERLGINRLEVKMPGQGPYHIHLNIKAPSQMQQYSEAVQKIKSQPIEKLSELNVNVLLCEQPLEDFAKAKLCAQGIFALETVDKKDTEALAKATGARAVGNLNDLCEEDIGTAEGLSCGKIDLEKTVAFSGCRGATFVLRGNTPQTIDELETAINNSSTVLKLAEADTRVVPGAGATETQLAQELKVYAKQFAGKEQLAIDAYAAALMEIPRCLSQNCGLNPTDALVELKQRHSQGATGFGVGDGMCQDMVCQEPLRVKRSVLRRAFEVSMLMLRIDELIISKEIPKFHKK